MRLLDQLAQRRGAAQSPRAVFWKRGHLFR
jgi:hypothetical protein